MGDHPNFCDFTNPFRDLSLPVHWSYPLILRSMWVLGLMLRTAPLNSSTLECLLMDQMKLRFFLFGGVVTVIATDLLSS